MSDYLYMNEKKQSVILKELLIDYLVREVSHRLSDGIPDFTNPKHIQILKDILYEHGADYTEIEKLISVISNNDSPIEEKQEQLDEARKGKSYIQKARSTDIEKVIDHLTSNVVYDQAIIDKMLQLVQRDQTAYYETLDKLKTYNIPDKNAIEIAEEAFSRENADKFLLYLRSRKLSIGKLHGKTLKGVIRGLGINQDFINWLTNYQWPMSPPMGSGEAALAVFLKDGAMSPGAGDVAVGGDVIEVKGSGGRLKGQHGFESGVTAAKAFVKELKALADKYKISVNIPKIGSNDFNLTGENWAVERVGMELIKQGKGKIKSSHIKKVWTAGFEAMWLNMSGDAKKYLKKATGEVKVDGSISDHGNTGKFKQHLLSATLAHYMDKDDFDTLVILQRDGKMSVLTKSDLSNPLKKITINSAPVFGSKAGTQGSTFQVSV